MKSEFFKNQAKIEATRSNERYTEQSTTLTNLIKKSEAYV
jgi:hypothetical protein